MSDTLLVSTRKGLFWVAGKHGCWEIERADFLGDNVSLTLTDLRSGRHFAALDHGHFGVKLHRSTAKGWAVELDEARTHFAQRLAVVLAEVGDGLVIRDEAPQQPHHLDVAASLTLEPPAGAKCEWSYKYA